MNYEDIFNDSYSRVLKGEIDGKNFFDLFYDKFIGSSPFVKEKFKNTKLEKQKEKVKKSFYHLIQFFVTKNVSPYMENIAKVHSKNKMDIEPYLYDFFAQSLIDAIKEFDTEFCDDVELSWRMVLSAGITYMKFQYDK